jgi:hypothetical protein
MGKSKAKKREAQQRNFEKNEQKIKNSGLLFIKKNTYLCPCCGNAMKIGRRLLVKNPVCRNCMTGQSFGENKTIEILKKYRIQYEKEKTFSGLKGIGNNNLRFDFYVEGERRKFLLEIDGEQHSKEVSWGLNTIAHDNIKNQFCKNNNIKLHRIKYIYGKLEKLESDVMKVLKSEISDSIIKEINYNTEDHKLMTGDEIIKMVEILNIKKNTNIPKDLSPLEEIKEGLEITIKMPKWLAKKNGHETIEIGSIKKITEKGILIKNEFEEFWLPKSFIKIYKKI